MRTQICLLWMESKEEERGEMVPMEPLFGHYDDLEV